MLNRSDLLFYRYFFTLAVPIIIQSFLAASLNMIDNIMVGQLGDAAIAGVGLANQVFFVLQLFLIGAGTGASLFAAQFWGKRDTLNIKRVLGLSLLIGLSVSGLYFLAVVIMPGRVIAIFTAEQDVISEGGAYLGAVSFSYLVTAFNFCMASVMRSIGRVRQPMIANVAGILVNTALNWVMIFGKLGCPALGVRGAAIATVIARFIEMLVLLRFIFPGFGHIRTLYRQMFSFNIQFVKRYFAISSVLTLKDVIWGVGVTVYMVIYGRMGKEVVAALNIVQTVRRLSTVVFAGYANACMIVVGNLLGASRFRRSGSDVKRIIRITVLTGILAGVLVILARPLIIMPYVVSVEVKEIVGNLLFITGFILTAAVINMVVVMGVLRGGGDANFSLVMDLLAVYVVGLPLGLLAGFVWKLDVYAVFMLINLQEFFKVALLFFRVRSRKWQRNLVHDLN
ncbi:MAG: MATE family efflux transporter [Spirochaetales bacterium]|nr:MATE family efflux transporter [Spirochaetales bacterium]